MDIKYNITKLKGSNRQEVQDSISVEEPLEMSLKFKIKDKWNTENISITMRTPGNDEDLIVQNFCLITLGLVLIGILLSPTY